VFSLLFLKAFSSPPRAPPGVPGAAALAGPGAGGHGLGAGYIVQGGAG